MSEKVGQTKSGMVSIIGRPNVGKSTLLNRIVGEKVAIVSPVPQTTRNPIRGIYTDERGQIVFIDTPGIHPNKDSLDKFMNKSSSGIAHEADCVIHLVDSGKRVGEDEEVVARRLSELKAPIILGLNKVDVTDRYIPDYIMLWEKVTARKIQELTQVTLLPLSGEKGTNVEKLLDLLFEKLPWGPALFPEDTLSDTPQRMVVADIIREKFFQIMREEVPHSLAVIIEDMSPRPNKAVLIQALVLVERDSQKNIVIGKGGQTLKTVGTLARKELEELLEAKVFIELYVKASPHWRDNPSLLEEMGYREY